MRKFLIPIVIILLGVAFNSIFVVQEGTRGIVLRFSKVIRNDNNIPVVYEPGLHFKIPFIDSVKALSSKIQTMDNQADRFVTREKKDLIVDSYIKWRIKDFSLFYLTTGGGNYAQAEMLLKAKFSDRLRSEIGRLDIQDIVTSSRSNLTTDVRDALNLGTDTDSASTEQLKGLINNVEKETNISFANINKNSMEALGIEVIDVRIKQINLPTEVSEAIYSRMRAEREAVARRHRSQGKENAERIRSEADYQAVKIVSEAEREARTLRGEGDAKATEIFAASYSKDPKFFTFLRSLNAYKNSFNENNVMVISPDNEFFRYMDPKNRPTH